MRRKLIAANWKMNLTKSLIEEFLGELKAKSSGHCGAVDVLVCPAFPYLSLVGMEFRNTQFLLGAQCCSQNASGAYTGDVSAEMLSDVGCSWVLCGHSERRQLFGETDLIVGRMAQSAASHGCNPLICVGETLDERKREQTDSVIQRQLQQAFSQFTQHDGEFAIAYEPIWAIGTGLTADSTEANRVHRMIREELSVLVGVQKADATRILYGGSVKSENSQEFMSQPHVDGVLIGGASLKPTSFNAIVSSGVAAISA